MSDTEQFEASSWDESDTSQGVLLQSNTTTTERNGSNHWNNHKSQLLRSSSFDGAVISIKIMARVTRDALQLRSLEDACAVLTTTDTRIVDLVAKLRGISVMEAHALIERLCSVHQHRDPFYRAAYGIADVADGESQSGGPANVEAAAYPEDDADDGTLTDLFQITFSRINGRCNSKNVSVQRFPGFFLSSPFDSAAFVASKNPSENTEERNPSNADDDDDDDGNGNDDNDDVLFVQETNGDVSLVSEGRGEHKRGATKGNGSKKSTTAPFAGPPGNVNPSSPKRGSAPALPVKENGARGQKRAKIENVKPPAKKKRGAARSPSTSSSEPSSESEEENGSSKSSRKTQKKPTKKTKQETGREAQSVNGKPVLSVEDALVGQMVHSWRLRTACGVVGMEKAKKRISEGEIQQQRSQVHNDILQLDACLPCVHRYLHTSERGYRLLPFLKEIIQEPAAFAALLYLSCSGCQKAGLGKDAASFFLNFILELGVEKNVIDVIANELYVIPRPLVSNNPVSAQASESDDRVDQQGNPVKQQFQYLYERDPRRLLLQIRPCETPFAHYTIFQLVNQVGSLQAVLTGRKPAAGSVEGVFATVNVSYFPDDITEGVLAERGPVPLARSGRCSKANLAPNIVKAIKDAKPKRGSKEAAQQQQPAALDAMDITKAVRSPLEEAARTAWAAWKLQDQCQSGSSAAAPQSRKGKGKQPPSPTRGSAKKNDSSSCNIPRFHIAVSIKDITAAASLRMWERTRLRVFMDALIVLLRHQDIWSGADGNAFRSADTYVETHEGSIATSIQKRAALCVHKCGNAFSTNPIGDASSDDYLDMASLHQAGDANGKSGDAIVGGLARATEHAFEKGRKSLIASPPPGSITASLKAHQQESLWWATRREDLGVTEYIAVPVPPRKEAQTGGAASQPVHPKRVLLYNPTIPLAHIVRAGSYSQSLLCQPIRGGMLCDEMGLGKTVVLLSLAACNSLPNSVNLADNSHFPLVPIEKQRDALPNSHLMQRTVASLASSSQGLDVIKYATDPATVERCDTSGEDVAMYNRTEEFVNKLDGEAEDSDFSVQARSITLSSILQSSPNYVQFAARYGRGFLRDLTNADPSFQKAYARRNCLIPSRATLVIVPVSLVGQWVSEIERFAPTASYIVFHGAKRHLYSVKDLQEVDFIITTYETTSAQLIVERDLLENLFVETMPHAEKLDETEPLLAELVAYIRQQATPASTSSMPVVVGRPRGATAASAAARTYTDEEKAAFGALKEKISKAIEAEKTRLINTLPESTLCNLDNGRGIARTSLIAQSANGANSSSTSANGGGGAGADNGQTREEYRFHSADQLLTFPDVSYPMQAANSRRKQTPLFSRFHFHRIILDESQKFSRTSSIEKLHATYRWCATGTPVNNKDVQNIRLPLLFLGFDKTLRVFTRPASEKKFQDWYEKHLIRCEKTTIKALNMYLARRGLRTFSQDIIGVKDPFSSDCSPDAQLCPAVTDGSPASHSLAVAVRNIPKHVSRREYGFLRCVCEGCSFQRVSGLSFYADEHIRGTTAIFPAPVGLLLSGVMLRHVKTDVIRRSMGIPRCTIVAVPHDMLPDERVLYNQIEQIVISEFMMLSRRGLVGNRMGHIMIWIQILCRLALHPRVAQDEVLTGSASSLHVMRSTEPTVSSSSNSYSSEPQRVEAITEELTPQQAIQWIKAASDEIKKRANRTNTVVDPVPKDTVECVNALTEVPPQFPQCIICLDLMSLPTVTECFHLFCKECVLSVIYSARATPQGMTTARCPLCRDRDSLRSKLRVIAAHVSADALPTDDAEADERDASAPASPTPAALPPPTQDAAVRRELSDMGLLRRTSSISNQSAPRHDGDAHAAVERSTTAAGTNAEALPTPGAPGQAAAPPENAHTVQERLARIGSGSRTQNIMALLGRIWDETPGERAHAAQESGPSTTPYDNVIIFSKYPHYLHILLAELRSSGHSASIIDGSTSMIQRGRILKTFQSAVVFPSGDGAACEKAAHNDEEPNEVGDDDDGHADSNDDRDDAPKRSAAPKKRGKRGRSPSLDLDEIDKSDGDERDVSPPPHDSTDNNNNNNNSAPSPPVIVGRRVLLLSSRAANAGLNLTFANHLIFAEPNINPSLEAQAIGRVHRYGQTKAVRVYHLYTLRTIEERLHDRMSGLLNSDMINNIDSDHPQQGSENNAPVNAPAAMTSNANPNTRRGQARVVTAAAVQFDFSEVAYLLTSNPNAGQSPMV